MSAQWFYDEVTDLLGSPADWFAQVGIEGDSTEKLEGADLQTLTEELVEFTFETDGTERLKLAAITAILKAYVDEGVELDNVKVEQLSVYLDRLVDDFAEKDAEWELSSALPGLFELCSRHGDESLVQLRGVSVRLARVSNKLVENYLSFVPFSSRVGSYMDWNARAESALAAGNRLALEALVDNLDSIIKSDPGNWILGAEFTGETTDSSVDAVRHRNLNVWIGLRNAASSLRKNLEQHLVAYDTGKFAARPPVADSTDVDFEADLGADRAEPGKPRTRWLA